MTKLVIAAVYAHPDDGEFFAAGTLAKWAAAGHDVYAICCTNGDLGTKDRRVSPPRSRLPAPPSWRRRWR